MFKKLFLGEGGENTRPNKGQAYNVCFLGIGTGMKFETENYSYQQSWDEHVSIIIM